MLFGTPDFSMLGHALERFKVDIASKKTRKTSRPEMDSFKRLRPHTFWGQYPKSYFEQSLPDPSEID